MSTTKQKPLSQAQIAATVHRMRTMFMDSIADVQRKEYQEAKKKARGQIERLVSSSATKPQREAAIKILMNSSGEIPGVVDTSGYRYKYKHPAVAAFDTKIADLEYALVMADNTSFQHHIDKFQAEMTKLLSVKQ